MPIVSHKIEMTVTFGEDEYDDSTRPEWEGEMVEAFVLGLGWGRDVRITNPISDELPAIYVPVSVELAY